MISFKLLHDIFCLDRIKTFGDLIGSIFLINNKLSNVLMQLDTRLYGDLSYDLDLNTKSYVCHDIHEQ